MNPAPPGRHTDLVHLAQAVETEVDHLLLAMHGRPTVDREKVAAARGHFGEGFKLVGQALSRTSTGP